MTLKQLQFFKKTAELENISKAASELYIAQPALSKSIILNSCTKHTRGARLKSSAPLISNIYGS